MGPRKLTVLRIDDALRRKKDKNPTVPQQDVPPKGLAIFTMGAFDRISTWGAALNFWVEYRGDQVPDLVVADVHFEKDQSSPLSRALPDIINHLPTGLSHLKPFAAMAKAKGILIGVGIHTADPRLWTRLIDSKDPRHRCMGYLAAHEIGELAAILGDAKFVGSLSDDHQLEPFWKWLITNSDNDFSQALNVAVRNYRHRLFRLADLTNRPDIFVMPNDLAAAQSWCAQMEKDPRPVNAENDCGLTLTYRDGRRDRISFASLFADVPKITVRALPGDCFRIPESRPGEEKLRRGDTRRAWELNDKALPLIGAFVASLGTLSSVFKTAADRVCQFPCDPDETVAAEENLRASLPDKEDALARGLVILFQLLRIGKHRQDEWENLYENRAWNPRELRFGEEYADQNSLKITLQKLLRLIRFHPNARSGEPFSRDEVFEGEIYNSERGYEQKVEWVTQITSACVDSDWVKWHFERLVEAGAIAHEPQDRYSLVNPEALRGTLPVPSHVPASLAAENAIFEKSLKEWLLESLGHARNYNAVGQIMFDAFVQPATSAHYGRRMRPTEKARAGRDFTDELVGGKGPAWLTRLCRIYAADHLQWYDRNTWPRWLSRQ